MAEYNKHVKDKHDEQSYASKTKTKNNKNAEKDASKNNKDKAKEASKKKKQDSVEIPCDICSFKSASAEDFIKHIETKHQHKSNKESVKPQYNCDKCDYNGTGEQQFKKHLEAAHKLNVGGAGQRTNERKPNRICLNWNRGHCVFDSKCKFLHEEIQACTFNNRCSRPDCRFWHEAHTGKFPFLDVRNLNPRAEFRGRY